MSKVIDFLERVGRDSRLIRASAVELSNAVQREQLTPELSDALIARDQQRLEQLLGARANVICGMAPAEDDAPEKKQDDDEEIRSSMLRSACAAG
ncbi:MAG: hypothetical protein JNN30_21565 [Rhodanobacteraceae bacterium]|nr:hypothetical protein [Rhodanobacteraceae bacterium]